MTTDTMTDDQALSDRQDEEIAAFLSAQTIFDNVLTQLREDNQEKDEGRYTKDQLIAMASAITIAACTMLPAPGVNIR